MLLMPCPVLGPPENLGGICIDTRRLAFFKNSKQHVFMRERQWHAGLLPQETKVMFGRDTLGVTLRGLRFEASPHAFLQTNTAQTEVLYRVIAEAAGEICDSVPLLGLLGSFIPAHVGRPDWT